MLATSTGVLMKEMPEHLDPDFVLSRHLRRATIDLSTAQHRSDTVSQRNSIVYRSESEFHEDTSPENAFEESASESGGNGEWDAESAWFLSATNDPGDIVGDPSSANAYLQMPETEDPQHGLQF